MKNTIKQVLETLKNTFGDSIFTDPKRFKAAHADVQIESYGKKIRNLLNIAMCDVKAYSRLETAIANKNLFVVDNLAMEMSDDYDINRDTARMVIESVAELLGYAPNAQPPSVVKPVQPTIQTATPTPPIISCPIAGDMVFVQGGTFKMGRTLEQEGSGNYDGEKPVHDVIVSDFYIGKYPVTQGLWAQVMGNNQYSSYFGKDLAAAERNKLPVEQVSRNDIDVFIKRLNQQIGKKYRLPTEAEWEYAARGGNKGNGYKYSGSNNVDDVAWYSGNNGKTTHPVGTKLPNELGIYDMSGNVWEWVNDWYGRYSANAETNPQGPSSGSGRVVRGGSWSSDAYFCRVSFRYIIDPDDRNDDLGFRLVLPSP
jgi:formylglycine-generating enzyme required for sulfatase activity